MIDINKQYTTRDGRETRIYCTDGGGVYPVHGAIKQFTTIWDVCTWTASGQVNFCFAGAQDLVEVPPRIDGWVNIYSDGIGFHCAPGVIHSSREEADGVARPDRIACIEIDVPHGHGLETK